MKKSEQMTICYDEGTMFEMPASDTLYGGQFILSTQPINQTIL